MKKKLLSVVTAIIMMTGISGCSQGATQTQPTSTTGQTQTATTSGQAQTTTAGTQGGQAGLYKAGSYKETVKGHNGDMEVEVVLGTDKLNSVKILNHVESAGISDAAIQRIPTEIIEKQSLAIDTVSGATVSSTAILLAVEQAVVKAGGDVAKLKEKLDGNAGTTKDVVLETDIVIVGGGGAGLAAAASAHQQGAKVLVLEKLAQTGGSTSLSGGGISAPGTRFQKEKGIKDSKESWMKLWKERQSTSNKGGIYPNYAVVDKFMDESIITTEWLVDYVKHEYGAIAGFGMDPVERLHFPVAKEGSGGGAVLTTNIKNFLDGENVEVLTETTVTDLIVDQAGNVTGVLADGKNGKVTVNAKKVILAAGGFAKNEKLLERFVPKAKGTAAFSFASAGSTGDGIVMAEKVGAVVYEEPWIIGLGITSRVPGTGSLMMDWSKLYVNTKGERFTNEQVHYSIASNQLLEQEGTWVVLDSSEKNKALIKAMDAVMPSEEVVKADSVEALAKAMNVSEKTLANTLTTYNQGVKSGKDALGKTKEFLVAVESAPYYAIKAYPLTMGTFGGVKTNDSFQVVKADGSVINNLYATGENANKVLYNQVYMSGSAIQFALTSGRIAGQHAAESLKK